MSSSNVYCSSCASLLEADCDFCTSCGTPSPAARPTETPNVAHSWMGNTDDQTERVRSSLISVPQYAPLVPNAPYSMTAPQTASQNAAANTARTLGIITLSLMAVGLIPCLGWLNYINLTLAFVTVIVSIIASSNSKTNAERSAAMIGLAFALIAGFVGFIRLILGGGCL
jgi:hypothetical protein